MREQPKVRARAHGGNIVVELTNGMVAIDERSEGHRSEEIEPDEAVALIRQIASAIERAGNQRRA